MGGPLANGRIVKECVVCPWHGYQFILSNGEAPEPYDDKVKTYEVKIDQGMVYVKDTPKEEIL